MVPLAGLEPARLYRAKDFESSASTNFTTEAQLNVNEKIYFKITAFLMFIYLILLATIHPLSSFCAKERVVRHLS